MVRYSRDGSGTCRNSCCLFTAVAVSLVGESLEILEGHIGARHRLYFPCILSLPKRISWRDEHVHSNYPILGGIHIALSH